MEMEYWKHMLILGFLMTIREVCIEMQNLEIFISDLYRYKSILLMNFVLDFRIKSIDQCAHRIRVSLEEFESMHSNFVTTR